MPAFPPVPNVLKVSIQHTVGGVPAWTHLYVSYTGSPPTSADAAAIANSIKSAWSTQFTALCSAQVIFTLAQVTDLNSSSGSQNQSSGTVTGTRAGAFLGAQMCMLFNQHIARRYRGGKPRQYWPFGVAADLADPQHWTTAFQSSCGTAYNLFTSAVTAITWTGGSITGIRNVSYFQGFTAVTNPVTGRVRNVAKLRPTPVVDTVSSTSLNPRVATQRRREHFSA